MAEGFGLFLRTALQDLPYRWEGRLPSNRKAGVRMGHGIDFVDLVRALNIA